MNPIGVVICNYNKKDFVLQCVQSVLESKEKNFDIYVVDNASSDGSAEALKKAYGNRITVIENKENLGGSGGFNTGLRIVRDKGYSYFMCLDDDAAVDENALSVLYHYMEEHTDTGMAGCRVYHTQMSDYIQQSGLLIDFDNCTAKTIGADMPEDGSLPDVIECDTVATCAVMVRADTVKQKGVGIMPEDNFIYWDDMEWENWQDTVLLRWQRQKRYIKWGRIQRRKIPLSIIICGETGPISLCGLRRRRRWRQ